MACRRGRLTTIYSIGEGRTIVFATDGCKACLQAFSVLIDTAPGSENLFNGQRQLDEEEDSPSSLGRKYRSMQRFPSDEERALGNPNPLSPLGNGPEHYKAKGPSRRRTPQLNVGELASGLDLAGVEPARAQSAKLPPEAPKPKAKSLHIYDPELPEEDREVQELTLRSSDRLIVALYTPPRHVSLPTIHHEGSPHPPVPSDSVGSASFRLLAPHLPAALGGLLGMKKPPPGQKSPNGLKTPKSADSHEVKAPVSKKTPEDPKVGPGHTTIFMPMAPWSEVEKSLERWESGRARDCVLRMAQTAREGKVRFEAIKLEERSPHSEDTAKAPGLHLPETPGLLGPSKKHSAGLGYALQQFCEGVEAGILVLGTVHSIATLDLNPKSFTQHLVEYCAEHCRCSVRILSEEQLKGLQDEPTIAQSLIEGIKPPEINASALAATVKGSLLNFITD